MAIPLRFLRAFPLIQQGVYEPYPFREAMLNLGFALHNSQKGIHGEAKGGFAEAVLFVRLTLLLRKKLGSPDRRNGLKVIHYLFIRNK
jgi:hypothetical protein